MAKRRLPPVYRPSRRDQRAARSILAKLGEGEASPVLVYIASRSIHCMVRFLAACNVTFVLIAWDEHRRFSAVGSPDAESVTELCLHLLGVRGEVQINAVTPLSVPEHSRLWSTRAAVEQIVDGLQDRGICFVLAWRLPGDYEVRLDHVLGATSGKVDEHLRWFLTEQLHVALPRAESPTCMDEVAVPK